MNTESVKNALRKIAGVICTRREQDYAYTGIGSTLIQIGNPTACDAGGCKYTTLHFAPPLYLFYSTLWILWTEKEPISYKSDILEWCFRKSSALHSTRFPQV